jgi:transposase
MEDLGVSVRQVRRRRSAAEKRLIVEQTLEPGVSVARVAQAHGLNANVVFHWRRQYRERESTGTGLVPVRIADDAPVKQLAARECSGSIRVELPGGVVVVIEGAADLALVAPSSRACERDRSSS